jgi:GDPmannose 4,6-dehydratase
MWLMLQQDKPDDYVIATGEYNKLSDFVELAFREVGLDWKEHVVLDPSFFRPTDLRRGLGDPSLSEKRLGWKAKYRMNDVVKMMIEAERGER